MRTFAFVFARGGSKGVPGKNLRMIGELSLLGHSIRMAQEIPEVEEVFVSTDSGEILEEADRLGSAVIHRPEKLATDTAPEWLAWQHAIGEVEDRYGAFDRFLSLPPTSPLRSREDVNAALELLDENTDAVVTIQESNRSPWFNMVREQADGFLDLLVPPNEGIVRRQDAPTGYDMTTVAYVSSPAFIQGHTRIWEGRVRGVVVPAERALDIDSELDLQIGEFLYAQRSNDL